MTEGKRWLQRFLLAIFVVFMVVVFPDRSFTSYQFALGKTWQYDDLIAPFSFPVQKLPEQLQSEEEAALSRLKPLYRRDTSLAFRAKLNLDSLSKASQDSISPRALALSTKLLNKALNKGILESLPDGRLPENLNLVNSRNEVSLLAATSFFSPRTALQWAFDTLTLDAPKEAEVILTLLKPCLERPNIIYDKALNEKAKRAAISPISPSEGKVSSGELLVAHSSIVDTLTYRKLISFTGKFNQEVRREKSLVWAYFGRLLLFGCLVWLFGLFISKKTPSLQVNWRETLFVLLMAAAFLSIARLMDGQKTFPVQAIPFGVIAIVLKSFYDSRLAVFTHWTVTFIGGVMFGWTDDFLAVQFAVGLVIGLTPIQSRFFRDFFRSLLFIFLAVTIVFIGIELLQKGVLFSKTTAEGLHVEGVAWGQLAWLALSVFLMIIAYPLVPLLEGFIGITSDITLAELSDLNRPLLKRLSMEAPGTLQHSLQVGHLAEAAAQAIGANTLLIKTAALYHDIGKLHAPHLFIENQNPAIVSPHTTMQPAESAAAIIAHISEGVKLAEQAGLPNILIDFIRTHHGTTRTEYFFRRAKEVNPDISAEAFTYIGPKPQTREQAILMIADTIEAAAKSLHEQTPERLDRLVDDMIAYKHNDAQFTDTDLTLKDLETVRKALKSVLKSMYHGRITYN